MTQFNLSLNKIMYSLLFLIIVKLTIISQCILQDGYILSHIIEELSFCILLYLFYQKNDKLMFMVGDEFLKLSFSIVLCFGIFFNVSESILIFQCGCLSELDHKVLAE